MIDKIKPVFAVCTSLLILCDNTIPTIPKTIPVNLKNPRTPITKLIIPNTIAVLPLCKSLSSILVR